MKKEVLYRIYQITLLIFYIGLMVFFTVKCLETGVKSSQSSGVVANTTAQVINGVTGTQKVDPKDPTFQQWVRKFIGHYGFFIALGTVSAFLYLSIKKIPLWSRILLHYSIGVGFAAFTEFALEGNTEGRGPSWKDVGLDSLGFLTLSICIIGFFIIKEIYNYKKNIK